MKKHYYAKSWPCGLAVTEKPSTGYNTPPRIVNVVNVARFDSASDRDKWVADYQAPNHCPSAFAEAVKSSDEDVRREQRAEHPEWTNL